MEQLPWIVAKPQLSAPFPLRRYRDTRARAPSPVSPTSTKSVTTTSRSSVCRSTAAPPTARAPGSARCGVRQAARALRPGYHVELGVAPAGSRADRRRRRRHVHAVRHRPRRAARSRTRCARSWRPGPAHRLHRRRPHHRAADAAGAERGARPGRAGALRRPPGHLGHLLQRAGHPRHDLPPGLRRGPARRGQVHPRRHPRPGSTTGWTSPTTHEFGFQIIRAGDLDVIGIAAAIDTVTAARRRSPRSTSPSTSTSSTPPSRRAPAPRNRAD